MSDKIEPALSPEEWAEYFASEQNQPVDVVDESRKAHALAALALHGQPFGFTREDVKALRFFAQLSFEDEGPVGEGWQSKAGEAAQELMPSLAARIEALLPPEKL